MISALGKEKTFRTKRAVDGRGRGWSRKGHKKVAFGSLSEGSEGASHTDVAEHLEHLRSRVMIYSFICSQCLAQCVQEVSQQMFAEHIYLLLQLFFIAEYLIFWSQWLDWFQFFRMKREQRAFNLCSYPIHDTHFGLNLTSTNRNKVIEGTPLANDDFLWWLIQRTLNTYDPILVSLMLFVSVLYGLKEAATNVIILHRLQEWPIVWCAHYRVSNKYCCSCVVAT